LDFREADRLEVTVLVDNYSDLLLLERTGVLRRPQVAPPDCLLAEHGLSFLLNVRAGSEEHVVLVDAGISPTSLFYNAGVLKADLRRVESVFLSHGHFDHFGGLIRFLETSRRGVPLVLHPEAFLQRRLNIPITKSIVDMPQLDEKVLSEAGAVLHKEKEASTLASGLVLVSGEVKRVTDFEKGFPWAEALIGGNWVLDPFHDDQGLAVKVKDRGLVVIGGCSHAGIINTVRHLQRVAGGERVHAVLGGFHLTGQLFDPIIGSTIREMEKLGPDFVVPMHCTGWKAINQFAAEMPGQFILNTVGTTYVFQ
jgi:7,8-dihydropterin-6-yl-methyl-4-(beta-D-ribofuranosyl)aminobenzene 5'-phosphate synthase